MFRRIALPLLLAFLQATFALGAAVYQRPDWRWWFSIIGTAVLGLIFAALVTVATERGHRARTKLDVENILQGAMLALSKEAGLNSEDISLRAFKLSRSASTLWVKQQHRSIGVARLKRGLPPLTIQWRKGVGVIGQCWERRHEVLRVPLAPLAKLRQEEWEELDPEAQMGFSWSDWTSLKDRYVGLVAYPIVEEKGFPERYKYCGCVTLGALTEDAWRKMDEQEAEATDAELASAATSIREALKA